MQTYELLVRNRAIQGNSPDTTLVRTSVGIDQVHVLFDSEEWLGFPVTITFAQGNDIVTQALQISELDGSDWVAEATVTVPYEVIDMTGPIRVTLQGTDSNGRHIITAAGSPLSVEEAGDVIEGVAPADAPTIDQWQQAYADAVAAANAASSLVSNLESRIASMVSDASGEMSDKIAESVVPATTESLGVVQVGNGLAIDEDGILSVTVGTGITTAQASQIENLVRLAYYCFNTTFDEQGLLNEGATVKRPAMQVANIDAIGAVKPDGVTVTIDADGTIHGTHLTHSWDGTVLTITDLGGSSSADLKGEQGEAAVISSVTASVDGTTGTPDVSVTMGGTDADRTFEFSFSGLKGEKGDVGPQGPGGYVLTNEDYQTIAALVRDGMANGDTTEW